jgi:hypothetical protein
VDETGPVDILVNNAGVTQLSQTFRSSGYDEALKSLEMFEGRMADFARAICVRRTLRPADLAVRARAARYLSLSQARQGALVEHAAGSPLLVTTAAMPDKSERSITHATCAFDNDGLALTTLSREVCRINADDGVLFRSKWPRLESWRVALLQSAA